MGIQHDKKRKRNKPLLIKEFLLFFTIPISIELVIPIRIAIAICLMVFFAVYAFKDMRT